MAPAVLGGVCINLNEEGAKLLRGSVSGPTPIACATSPKSAMCDARAIFGMHKVLGPVAKSSSGAAWATALTHNSKNFRNNQRKMGGLGSANDFVHFPAFQKAHDSRIGAS